MLVQPVRGPSVVQLVKWRSSRSLISLCLLGFNDSRLEPHATFGLVSRLYSPDVLLGLANGGCLSDRQKFVELVLIASVLDLLRMRLRLRVGMDKIRPGVVCSFGILRTKP